MIRYSVFASALATLVACNSSPNPWAVKKWNDASMRAWSEECAGTTRTARDDTNGIVSFSTSYELEDTRLDRPDCTIMNDKHGRLHSAYVSVRNVKALTYPTEYTLTYAKQLGMITALVPPEVAAVVRSVARGPKRREVKGPFIIEGGFDSPGQWRVAINLR